MGEIDVTLQCARWRRMTAMRHAISHLALLGARTYKMRTCDNANAKPALTLILNLPLTISLTPSLAETLRS